MSLVELLGFLITGRSLELFLDEAHQFLHSLMVGMIA
jgi:hypothetical protein